MKTLFIFDFDDTLALTDSHVIVNNSLRLNSREFAKYRASPKDNLDFSEFMDVSDGKLIQTTVSAMDQAIKQFGFENVYIVTARSEAPPVKRFLLKMGVEPPEIIATSGSENKARWLINKLMSEDYNRVVVYEDCRKNIEMLKDVVKTYNSEMSKNIYYSSVCVVNLEENRIRTLIKKLILETIYMPSEVDISAPAREWRKEIRSMLSPEEKEAADRMVQNEFEMGLEVGGLPSETIGQEKPTINIPILDTHTITHQFKTDTFDYSTLDIKIKKVIQEQINFFKEKKFNPSSTNPFGRQPSLYRGAKRFLKRMPVTSFYELFSIQPLGPLLISSDKYMQKFKERVNIVIEKELHKLKTLKVNEMKITKRHLKRIIKKALIEHVRVPSVSEPAGYVEDHAEMYAEDEDWEGYVKFGRQYGYDEGQLSIWFEAAEDALFQNGVDSYEPEPIKRGFVDSSELERDFRSGKIDLARNPYTLD
tara:strand:+ start:5311 stop:6744 length:1434 start_codon:yes stop_codon:yes gene_type:complete